MLRARKCSSASSRGGRPELDCTTGWRGDELGQSKPTPFWGAKKSVIGESRKSRDAKGTVKVRVQQFRRNITEGEPL
jgi:hypothetical protein